LTETDFPEINPVETSFYEIAINWHVPNFINKICQKRSNGKFVDVSAMRTNQPNSVAFDA
jgi:hypothetical protein